LTAQQVCQTIQPESTVRTSALDQQTAHAAWISKPDQQTGSANLISKPD